MAAMIKAILPDEKVPDPGKEPGAAEGGERSSSETLLSDQKTLKDLKWIENQIREVRDCLERAEKKRARRSWIIEEEPGQGKSAAALRFFRAFYEEATRPGSGNRYWIAPLEETLDGVASTMTIFPDEDELGAKTRAPSLRQWHTGNAVRSEWQRVGRYLRTAMEEVNTQATKEDDVGG